VLLGARAGLLSVFMLVAAMPAGHAQMNVPPSAPMPRTEAEALAFLKSLPRMWAGTSRRNCKTYDDKNIDRLSPSFALDAARFLHAFVEMHGHVAITSAHRTAEEQACVCEGERGPCAGRPRIIRTKKRGRIVKRGISRHQQGIALDVRAGTGTNDEFACLHEFAQFNPQFGVHFPLGKRDRPHMEPAASKRTSVRVAGIGAMGRKVVPCATLTVMLEHLAGD
jgi:hypothetical protein